MAVNEHSIGRLYLAQMQVPGPVPMFRLHREIQITEECDPPWRRGKALMFTLTWRRAILLGWWKKQETEKEWFGGEQLFVQPKVIGTWWDGSEEEEDEAPEAELT